MHFQHMSLTRLGNESLHLPAGTLCASEMAAVKSKRQKAVIRTKARDIIL